MGMTSVTCLLSGPFITSMDLELLCLCGLNFPSEKKTESSILLLCCYKDKYNTVWFISFFVFLLISRDHNVPWAPR